MEGYTEGPQRKQRAVAARAAFNTAVVRFLDGSQGAIARHWLAMANAAMAVFLILPIVAPLLLSASQEAAASWIYEAYSAVCHQWPFRSFFMMGPQATYSMQEVAAMAGPEQVWAWMGSAEAGYKMAFCQRDLAIVAAALAMGLFYALVRRRLAPPKLRLYLLFLLPIALDGFTQLGGWRESTWELRLGTGLLTGIATVWLIFPYLEIVVDRELASAQLVSHQ